MCFQDRCDVDAQWRPRAPHGRRHEWPEITRIAEVAAALDHARPVCESPVDR